MTFISYAQNQEDVLLWRALQDVVHGVYVDVGASDPVRYSVTKAFYDRGWSGINIEPSIESYGKLVAARPRDVNLNTAVADHKGEITFYDVKGGGLSTIVPSNAETLQALGADLQKTIVPCDTLSGILARTAFSQVHFLKIDVEGAEEQVLRSANLAEFRPWIIVIEATKPNSTISTYQEWEPIILNARYLFAYFDGLNRYYVSSERKELIKRFEAPVSVFDSFVPYDVYLKMNEIKWLQMQLLDYDQIIVQLRTRESEVRFLNASLRSASEAHENALSQFLLLKERYDKLAIVSILGFVNLVLRSFRFLAAYYLRAILIRLNMKWMRKTAKRILNRFPQVEQRIRAVFGLAPAPSMSQGPVRPARPETRASRLLADLRGERGQS